MNRKRIIKENWVWLIAAVIVLFIAIGVLIRADFLFHHRVSQVIVAILGAIITIIATRLLLESQKKAKRESEMYSKKLEVYSEFVSNMYKILDDGIIDKDEILKLRNRIFGEISFYATENVLKEINEALEKSCNYEFSDITIMQEKFNLIADILHHDLVETYKPDPKDANKLWETFNGILDPNINPNSDETIPVTYHYPYETIVKEKDVDKQNIDITKVNFWHFTMYSASEQIKAIQHKEYVELNLVEYGDETWRTRLLKEVKANDLVFLFRSGGPGYMGVFRAIGWHIFDFNNGIQETFRVFDEVEKNISDPKSVKSNLDYSDIYKSYQDGAHLCSSLIVQPLSYAGKGIGNPGGIYRKTISRYDRNYGLKQLARFIAIKGDNENNHIQCNEKLFNEITKDIPSAKRNENGKWLDL